MNSSGAYAASVPNTSARLPCSRSWFASSFAASGDWVAKTTTFTFPPICATSDEKSSSSADTDSRVTVTPSARSPRPMLLASGIE